MLRDASFRRSSADASERVLVGLGNTILSDDGVGILVARAVAEMTPREQLSVVEQGTAGLDLIELLSGYREAHLVDAIITGREPPGHLHELELGALPPTLTLFGSHEVDLPTALELGASLGYAAPSALKIWAVEVLDPFTVSETLSPEVAERLPFCAKTICRALGFEPPSVSPPAPPPRPGSARR